MCVVPRMNRQQQFQQNNHKGAKLVEKVSFTPEHGEAQGKGKLHYMFLEHDRLVADEGVDVVFNGDTRELLLVDVRSMELRERAWLEVQVGAEELPRHEVGANNYEASDY